MSAKATPAPPNRPERHYMRGPGPGWHAVSQPARCRELLGSIPAQSRGDIDGAEHGSAAIVITLMGDFALIAYATELYLALLFVLYAVPLPVNALRLWQATPAFCCIAIGTTPLPSGYGSPRKLRRSRRQPVLHP